MLNMFRYVDYDDDGCSKYQCLKCKAEWSARYFGEIFCGYCGTKWGSNDWKKWNYEMRWPQQWTAARIFKYLQDKRIEEGRGEDEFFVVEYRARIQRL